MRLLVFGLSISSSWGNGHATVYRGLLRALARVGVEVTFVEKETAWYASNRDLWDCDYARIVLYRDASGLEDLLASEFPAADSVMLGSYFPDGILVADRLRSHGGLLSLYYDIDTPVTLGAFSQVGAAGYLRADQIPLFDLVLSFTGGPALDELENRWGARQALALYCGLDPDTHRRTEPDDRFRCRLSYMGTYSPDRQHAWEALFLRPAEVLPEHRFVLAGPQYPETSFPSNFVHYSHLPPSEHPAFYSSSDITLNITRGPMVAYGFSPSVRLFEAAGCATCVVSDRWNGLGELFEVGRELLVADSEAEMVHLLRSLGTEEVAAIGERVRRRALSDHTYDVRAWQLMELVRSL